ncbi:energy-coupling factor transporter ATPase [Allobaculum sp. JKK-2023]|uniref:energy-coupling factor transporter ATPase n=1 Tax=Allobaculum sp. JKK-2023 TaxID=3108943 RepID=UPI002B0625A8|nr:energy-coupling factor transporter ATPase [Allobaculum sp. JKK-2023]
MEAIALDRLSFSYDGETPVLKDISLSIPQGSYTAIVGHNGSGKSTLAKLIIGLLEAGSGTIQVLGTPLTDETLSEVRDHVGIVFQNPDNQFIGSTVADDIAFGLENHCVPTEQMQSIIEESAAKVGMSAYLDAEPTNLSGGQKQRVAIAGILAMAPDIIIFDESTSMLDPQGKASVNAQIRCLNEEKNITILSITHDMEEAAQAEQVIVLDKGSIAAVGKPEEVFLNDQLMNRLRLELPFALKAARAFNQAGLNLPPVLTTEDLVEELCPSK